MNLEAIIGRDEQQRLLVKVGQGAFLIGMPGSVPKSVSHAHCHLAVDFSEDALRKVKKIIVKNLKSQNVTYVEGNEVETKVVNESSKVELGYDRYVMDLAMVIAGMRKLLPPAKLEIDISSLKPVWEEYKKACEQIDENQRKIGVLQRFGGLLITTGVALACIPQLGYGRVFLAVIALAIAVYCFVKSSRKSADPKRKRAKLNEDFQKKYVCPNPECRCFMGFTDYDLLKQKKRCPYCGASFKNT